MHEKFKFHSCILNRTCTWNFEHKIKYMFNSFSQIASILLKMHKYTLYILKKIPTKIKHIFAFNENFVQYSAFFKHIILKKNFDYSGKMCIIFIKL